jgi:hypothetical protein
MVAMSMKRWVVSAAVGVATIALGCDRPKKPQAMPAATQQAVAPRGAGVPITLSTVACAR